MWVKEFTRNAAELQQIADMDWLYTNPAAHARHLYLNTMVSLLTGLNYGHADVSINAKLGNKGKLECFGQGRRRGEDWPGFAVTMVTTERLQSLQVILLDLFNNNVEGDILETGVWKGGASIFAAAVVSVHGQAGRRKIFVCDSFQGLPPSELKQDSGTSWNETRMLEQSDATVKHNFGIFGIEEPNIVFVKGFFATTMPVLSNLHTGKIALLRLDGDMYESTVDVLYAFYEKLSVGGVVIIDDWEGLPAKKAVEDFFTVHGINPPLQQPDKYSVYWRKDHEIQIQYWRYEQKVFT
ncbi:unnamed protein product [Ectocarpus fasciculatus]